MDDIRRISAGELGEAGRALKKNTLGEYDAKSITLRPEVMIFAKAMENKLRENASKGSWRDCEETYLDKRIDEELEEFRAALGRGDNILGEAADVANYLMMMCDVTGYLPRNRRG